MATLPRHYVRFLALFSIVLAGTPTHALVSTDDGKNQLYVTANAIFGWDSNIFGNNLGSSDYLFSAGLGVEFLRHAGMIGVNGSVGIDATRFADNSSENSLNPRFNTEFSKQNGRTTGALTLGAARQNRIDSAANLRSEVWDYDAGLSVKYPVIERYSLSGSLGYTQQDYINNNLLVDLETYSASLDLFYAYASERDLFAGYRYRHGDTSASTSFDDHAFTVGVSGKILPKLAGSIRLGYQIRQPHGALEDEYRGLTASASATWNLNKRFNLTGSVAQDFSTTSTNYNIDTLSCFLDAQYTINAKFSLYAGAGYGRTLFLGQPGADRRDTFLSWNVGAGYSMNEHLKVTITYSHLQNWSTLDYADYKKNSVNLGISSRF